MFLYQSEVNGNIAVNVNGNGDRPGCTNGTFSMGRLHVQLCHLVWSYNRTEATTNIPTIFAEQQAYSRAAQ